MSLDLNKLYSLFYEKFSNIETPNFKITNKSFEKNSIILSISFLTIKINCDEIIVEYADEHDGFYKNTYINTEKWIDSVCSFIKLFSSNKAFIEYYYTKNNKLLFYKIWVEKTTGKKHCIKKVSLTFNPLKIFCKKIKRIKYINAC